VRLEGLGQLKNPVTSSGNQTRDLPACSIVPQPTTLPREVISYEMLFYINEMFLSVHCFTKVSDNMGSNWRMIDEC
jgi:hypothetical protein